MKSKQVYFSRIMLVFGVLALAGCASLFTRNEDASVIKTRAVQRWDYLIAHQADKAYDFLSPGYRTTIARENYARDMNSRPVTWESAEFLDQKCDADTCTVHVKLKYLVMVNLHGVRKIQGDSPVTERWIKESGHWYYLPDSRYKAPKPKQ
ncbi:MAG: hypothetical protein ACREPN_06565 [Rudaea sp.]